MAYGTVNTYGTPPYKIALLHGGPGACGTMGCVARELSSHCGVLEPWQSRHSLFGLIEELHAQLTGTPGADQPITLLGHSWGAWLAVLYAAEHPRLVRQLVLVGSGPFQDEFVPLIAKRRMANLTEAEGQEFRSLLRQLEGDAACASGRSQGDALARLGALAAVADSYDPLEDDSSASVPPPDAGQYAAIWPQAAELRSNGALVRALRALTSPVTVIHGEQDPTPIEGVVAPLAHASISADVHLLPRCGHSPFLERHGKEPFYEIVRGLVRP